jgi:eukaryotic translation initiation factor 2C
MGGPGKRRAEAEKKGSSSSGNSSGHSRNATERSAAQSIPRLDGNRDPVGSGTLMNAIDYSRPQDLKNISEALGYAGWCIARGVSTNAFLPCFPTRPPHSSGSGSTCRAIKRPAIAVFTPDLAMTATQPRF